jgi:biotin carboxyl carrier protein
MEYKISIGPDSRTVEIDSSGGDKSSLCLAEIQGKQEGRAKIILLERVGNRLILSLEDRVYSVIIQERSFNSFSFLANGRAYVSKVGSTRSESTTALVASASEMLTSNFPSKVVKIVGKKGESLKRGDTLVILEAMKMEAQIKAPQDCSVEEIFIKEGDMVGKGKPLMRLKFR